ncbi:YlxR family protein [Mycolicibacterium sp. 22603]|uniref:YlxR family protein n=1 Tax=Mycolicibacterium sp. 22603 TaxID=3453950 RepID=UPI003F83643A
MIQRETPAGHSRAHRDPAGPVRTCVGCRKRALAVDLVRLSSVSDRPGDYAVTVDTAGNLPGRGAWLHPDPQCLDVALRRRAIGRALRISGSPDTTVVEELFHRSENR